MDTPKFYTKKGELTAYGLACGYVEKNRIFNAISYFVA